MSIKEIDISVGTGVAGGRGNVVDDDDGRGQVEVQPFGEGLLLRGGAGAQVSAKGVLQVGREFS